MSIVVSLMINRKPSGKYDFACGTLSCNATEGEKMIAAEVSQWLSTLCSEEPSEPIALQKQSTDPTTPRSNDLQ